MNIQENVFHAISKHHSSQSQMVENLKKLLNLSQASIYKRLNGSISLSIAELETLINHFEIDITSVFRAHRKWLKFDFPIFHNQQANQRTYIQGLVQELQAFSTVDKGVLKYLSTDLPVFYYFIDQKVANFKLFVYEHTIWSPADKRKKLQKFYLNKPLASEKQCLFNRINNIYGSLDTEEIWAHHTFEVTVGQIKYALEAGYFAIPEESLELIDCMMFIVDQLEEMVSVGNKNQMCTGKTGGGYLKLRYNDVSRFTSTILTIPPENGSVYLTYDLPNYLKCSDPEFVKYTNQWMNNVKLNSYPLTGNTPRNQHLYFNDIRKSLLSQREILETLI
ncbi:MAG: hypothetical protein AAFY36_00145 [Bacteroidota bacterium]